MLLLNKQNICGALQMREETCSWVFDQYWIHCQCPPLANKGLNRSTSVEQTGASSQNKLSFEEIPIRTKKMAPSLSLTMDCLDVPRVLLPFLDLYDTSNLSAAARGSPAWTRLSPWYQAPYVITPGEYLAMKANLPACTFKRTRKLQLELHIPHQERIPETLNRVSKHMQDARRYLPSLEAIVLCVWMDAKFKEESDDEYYRISDLLQILIGVKHIQDVTLDLSDIDVTELENILESIKENSHRCVKLYLPATTPRHKLLRKRHSLWLRAIAKYLETAALHSLQHFSLHLDVACNTAAASTPRGLVKLATSVLELPHLTVELKGPCFCGLADLPNVTHTPITPESSDVESEENRHASDA